jgi:hypothetical protein
LGTLNAHVGLSVVRLLPTIYGIGDIKKISKMRKVRKLEGSSDN